MPALIQASSDPAFLCAGSLPNGVEMKPAEIYAFDKAPEILASLPEHPDRSAHPDPWQLQHDIGMPARSVPASTGNSSCQSNNLVPWPAVQLEALPSEEEDRLTALRRNDKETPPVCGCLQVGQGT
jgi:hypothetical protein